MAIRTIKRGKPKHVKGKVLRVSARIQQAYVGAIEKAIDRMMKDVRTQYTELFKRDYAHTHFRTVKPALHVGTMDASVGSQTRILTNKLKSKYDQLFGELAMGLSPWMADSINQNSADQTR